MKMICVYCGKESERMVGHINRAKKLGAPIFCNKTCFGLNRRLHKSKEQKVAEKRLYDMKYRKKNREEIKVKKAEYYQRTHDPVKEAKARKSRMHLHVEYCRQPEYKEWKKSYDRAYLARKSAGEFWESKMLLLQLKEEIDSKMDRYERSIEKGYYNKAQHRRREYEKLNCD